MTTGFYIFFPGWTPLLIWLFCWLYKKRPYVKKACYNFPRCKFKIELKRW